MNIIRHTTFLIAFCASLVIAVQPAHTQLLDAPYVTTPHEIVAAMLDVANVGPGDYLIDMGSGDGRIVIAAAARGAFGHGMDLDPARVREAEENAVTAEVADRVQFFEQNIFDADIRRATVVTMYLMDSVNLRLRAMLFDQLRPGTRVVSYTFDMGEWEADRHLIVKNRDVYYWIMPANLTGTWVWRLDEETYRMAVHQTYQQIDIALSVDERHLQIGNPVVRGQRVTFQATDPATGRSYAFNGRVEEHTIAGTIQWRSNRKRAIAEWNATLREADDGNPFQQAIHRSPQLPPALWPW